MKQVFPNLDGITQRACVLLFNNVYVKTTLRYHGGIIFEKAVK